MHVLILLWLFLLSACSVNQKPMDNTGRVKVASQGPGLAKTFPVRYSKNDKDGAPKGPLPSFFQKIIPKREALSRYGNPATYAVDGRNYEVLKSASGYKKRGLASWYGTKFQSQRTSSGEHYNMYAMTAAHKTLPLPSYLRVKNLDNGREAIVKVNDRGPFHSNRIIDLSYAAATKLGVLPKGTARVEIEAVTIKNAGKEPIANYYVQAGAFNSQKLAGLLKNKLSKWTASPVFIEKIQGKYLVKAGPFANRSMTLALNRVLEKNGVRGSFNVLQ